MSVNSFPGSDWKRILGRLCLQTSWEAEPPTDALQGKTL